MEAFMRSFKWLYALMDASKIVTALYIMVVIFSFGIGSVAGANGYGARVLAPILVITCFVSWFCCIGKGKSNPDPNRIHCP